MGRLFRVELGRLLQSRVMWAAVLATLALPLAGYGLFPMLSWTTMATIYLANPICVGTLGGTLVFAALTLYELDRVWRFRMEAITDSVVSPAALAVARLAGIGVCALLTATLGFALYGPYTAWRLDLVFSLGDYALCWFLVVFPGLAFGSACAGVCYFVVGRADVSFLAAALFLLVPSYRGYTGDAAPWWQWGLVKLPALSDDFGNTLVLRIGAYTRLIWLCLFGGAVLLGLLCLRRYGKGLMGSFLLGLRRMWAGALAAVCLLSAGGLLWRYQPFLDHTPDNWIGVEEVDYMTDALQLVDASALVDASHTRTGIVSGRAVYRFENVSGEARELYFEMNSGYAMRSVRVNGERVPVTDCQEDYIAGRYWSCPVPAERDVVVELEYGGMPRLWNVSGGMYLDRVVSSRYVALDRKCVAPTPQTMILSENTPYRVELTLPAGMTPVSAGAVELLSSGEGTCTWAVEETGRASISVYAADFVKADLEGGGVPIEFYFSEKHREQLEALDAVSAMEEAVAYCTAHYGPRTFDTGKPFKILQLTEFEFGGFASGNISATLEESFTTRSLQDREKGASGAEVLAHEIIHQWWGLGVMLQDPEDPFWTSEGMTTYSTYRLMEARYGEEYARVHYLEPWEAAVEDSANNFYVRNPEYLDRLPDLYRGNIEAAIQSVNWYSGTALMIKRAEALVGGQEAMDAILSKLYREGGTELGPAYVTLGDFLTACGLTEEAVGRG